jgi:hypothetical protein
VTMQQIKATTSHPFLKLVTQMESGTYSVHTYESTEAVCTVYICAVNDPK